MPSFPHTYYALKNGRVWAHRALFHDCSYGAASLLTITLQQDERLDADRMDLLGHILPDSNAAPALQAHQIELERNMKADNLENALKHRPDPEDLVNKGILSENPASA